MRVIAFIPIFALLSCNLGVESESVHEREDTDETVQDSLPADSIPELLDENDGRFDTSPFAWHLHPRTQYDEELVFDIAALVYISENQIDTVYFWTARGPWFDIKDPEERFEEFPENTEITMYSETESCYFSIKQETTERYIILFGGIEDGKSYAVVEQGTIWIKGDEVTYDIFLPEEVETYTDYGLDL